MAPVLVIAHNRDIQSSISRYLLYVGGINAQICPLPVSNANTASVPGTFERLSEWIIAQTASDCESSLRRAIAVVDLQDAGDRELKTLNPLSTTDSDWLTAVAMLVLAFPEIHWVSISYSSASSGDFYSDAHEFGLSGPLSSALRLRDQGYTCLFDPVGLRNNIRERLCGLLSSNNTEPAVYIPIRNSVAASIDEEQAYSFFCAYASYRMGYRSWVVSSYAMMEKLFGDSNTTLVSSVELLFEDLYLNFPDKSSDRHLSLLRIRDSAFGLLQDIPNRLILTVGHGRTNEIDNRRYQGALRRKGKYVRVLYKPMSGIYDLWRRSGLSKLLRSNEGRASGFHWPPEEAPAEHRSGRHSAPGRLLSIAECLLGRAERLLKTAQSVPDAVLGATLALEACEYLGNRTPTTSLEALALKHQLEVVAECMFYGVEYNMDAKSRLYEIRKEVSAVGSWFRSKTRLLSIINAEIGIVSALTLRFREHNQFDEEQVCLARTRDLCRCLWFRRNRIWAWPFWPVRWYAEFLLRSIGGFSAAIALWILLFSFAYGSLIPSTGRVSNWMNGPFATVVSFFGMQPPAMDAKDITDLSAALCMFTIVVGVFHFGILVSHLYSMIARR